MPSIRPDALRLAGGLLLFVAAVLLCAALGANEYVISHILVTLSGASLPFPITADQSFTLGSFRVCSSITFTQTDSGAFLLTTNEACPSISSSCTTYLQLEDPFDPTQNLYPGAGLPVNVRSSCAVFRTGRAFLVQAAVDASFTALLMIFMRCEALERLFARLRWSRRSVDRLLLTLTALAALDAIIAIACQPDDVNNEWEGSFCSGVLSADPTITGCQFTSAWGASYGCHVAGLVLCLVALGVFAGGYYKDTRGNPDFAVPLNAAAGGVGGVGDSESMEYGRAG